MFPVNEMLKLSFFFFAADRAQHFDEKIIPALKKGSIVISDRMADSSLVYQGVMKGLDLEMLKTINAWCMQNVKPHATFICVLMHKLHYKECMIEMKKLLNLKKKSSKIKKH